MSLCNDVNIENKMQEMNFGGHSSTDATAVAGGPLTVTQFNAIARQLIEQKLPLLWIAGEISNFTRAPSGHCYFSLKDERAQVRCVMFRHRMQTWNWSPAMVCRWRSAPSRRCMRPAASFSSALKSCAAAGLGALYEKFARLKTKLEAEGLFAVGAQAPAPAFPEAHRRDHIAGSRGVARCAYYTSPTHACDPGGPVSDVRCRETAPARKIAAAIATADARAECDVLILCRGGGSIEDLWAFNEELVARAMVACRIPIVSGRRARDRLHYCGLRSRCEGSYADRRGRVRES